MAPNLSFGSGLFGHRLLTGSPDPRQHPFGSGTSPCPASYAGRPAEDRPWCPGFLLPFGCRHLLPRSSDPRWGLGPRLRSADQPRHRGRAPSGFPRSAHTRYDRGGCLLYPGGGGAHPADEKSPTGACRFPAASPCTPPTASHLARLAITRHQRRFTRFTRPVCPLPVTPGWSRSPLAFPRASDPAAALAAATHVKGGARPSSTRPGATHPV